MKSEVLWLSKFFIVWHHGNIDLQITDFKCTFVFKFHFSCYRFLFVLLGPPGKAKSYNEIGRAIATLMVDDVSMNIIFFSEIQSKSTKSSIVTLQLPSPAL